VLYLASTLNDDIRKVMLTGRIGALVTPRSDKPIDKGVRWAADNGCFSNKWSSDHWLRFLDRRIGQPDCLFAVVPDVVGNHNATVERFHRWAPEVRDRGFPVAFVGQDGATIEDTPWDHFDAWFAGGSTQWKLGEAFHIHTEALRRNKWTHMGRVNSEKRFRLAAGNGYHSADGTYLAFGPNKNLPNLLRWINNYHADPYAQLPITFTPSN